MSSFLYWFQNVQTGLGQFRARGLGERFADNPTQTVVGERGGPSGRPGLVFHHAGLHGVPADVLWFDRGDWALGWERDFQPAPGDLRRADRQPEGPTYRVKLRDGHEWEFPVVLPHAGRESALPHVIRFAGDTGDELAETIEPAYGPLVQQAQRFRDAFEAGSVGLPMWPYACALLGVYYRIGQPEIVAMDLLDRRRATVIVAESFDATEILRARVVGAADAGLQFDDAVTAEVG